LGKGKAEKKGKRAQSGEPVPEALTGFVRKGIVPIFFGDGGFEAKKSIKLYGIDNHKA
jgi:hypothetical protein